MYSINILQIAKQNTCTVTRSIVKCIVIMQKIYGQMCSKNYDENV